MCGPSKFKTTFLKDELWMLAVTGAFQHNKVYSPDISDIQRIKFKECIKEYIECFIIPQYYRYVSEKQHIANLEELQNCSRFYGKGIILNSRLNIGTVQKLLNLYLKYLWCIGEIAMLPHCPIDSTVLKAVGLRNFVWTKIDTISKYEYVIEAIKNKIKNVSIAYWELNLFNCNRKEISCCELRKSI